MEQYYRSLPWYPIVYIKVYQESKACENSQYSLWPWYSRSTGLSHYMVRRSFTGQTSYAPKPIECNEPIGANI